MGGGRALTKCSQTLTLKCTALVNTLGSNWVESSSTQKEGRGIGAVQSRNDAYCDVRSVYPAEYNFVAAHVYAHAVYAHRLQAMCLGVQVLARWCICCRQNVQVSTSRSKQADD